MDDDIITMDVSCRCDDIGLSVLSGFICSANGWGERCESVRGGGGGGGGGGSGIGLNLFRKKDSIRGSSSSQNHPPDHVGVVTLNSFDEYKTPGSELGYFFQFFFLFF